MKKTALTLAVIWLCISLIGLTWYLIAVEWLWQALYYYTFIFGFGIPLWLFRHRIIPRLQNWKLAPWIKFLLLGYGMVLFEEVLAALFNHLSEGFQLGVYLLRIEQFWAFNLFAFTGLIVAWYFLYSRIRYPLYEALILCGIWGLYTEGTIFFLASAPLFFVILTPLNIITYGLIMAPALLSIKKPGTRIIPPLTRYLLAFGAPLLLSIIPDFVETSLRGQWPAFFPPEKFIPR